MAKGTQASSEKPAGKPAGPGPGPGEQPVKEKDVLINLAGIWSNTSKSGAWYGRGSVGNVTYYILPNTRKKSPEEPDYQICIGKRPPKKEADKKPSSPAGPPADEEEELNVDPTTGEIIE